MSYTCFLEYCWLLIESSLGKITLRTTPWSKQKGCGTGIGQMLWKLFLWSLRGDIRQFWFACKPALLLTRLASSKPWWALSFVAVTYINSKSQLSVGPREFLRFLLTRKVNGALVGFVIFFWGREMCTSYRQGRDEQCFCNWYHCKTCALAQLPREAQQNIFFTNHELYACYSG